MPHAIERSLATPIMRPCFPAIRAILFSFATAPFCGDRACAPLVILHEPARPGEQPPIPAAAGGGGPGRAPSCSFNRIRRIRALSQPTENDPPAAFMSAV